MKKMFTIIALTMLFYFPISFAEPATSISTYVSGDTLLSWCKDNLARKSTYAALDCAAYVAGALDSYNSYLGKSHSQNSLDCYNKRYPGITLNQTIRLPYQY